jgi:hypothetical protein
VTERCGEAGKVGWGRERDNDNSPACPVDLPAELAQLPQVLLAKEAAEVAKQDEDGRPPKQRRCLEGPTFEVDEGEIERNLGHCS